MKRLVILLALSLGLGTFSRAQEPQLRSQEQLISPSVPATNAVDVIVPEGARELGVQRLLRRVPGPTWINLSSDTQLLYLDNAFLSSTNRLDDRLFVESLGLAITPPLGKKFSATLAVNHQWFRYDSNPGLDFDASSVGLTLGYQPREHFRVYGGYTGLWLDGRVANATVYSEGNAVIGAQYWQPMNKQWGVSAGLQLEHHNTHPAGFDRIDAALSLGTRYAFTRQFVGEMYYRLQFEDFDNSSRQDFRNQLAAALVYELCKNAALRLTVSHVWNESNAAGRDYRSLTTGGALALLVKF